MQGKLVPGSSLIFGCGYVGRQVARRLADLDAGPVYGVTRSTDKAQQLAATGVQAIVADWTDRRSLSKLPRCDRVLVAVSYDPASRLSRYESQVGGLGNLLDVLPAETDLVYLSTTGVYHQSDGGWVDETSPARPQSAGGLAHLQAEQLLHRRRPAAAWGVLRLAGLYGPGRIPRLGDIVAGRPLGAADGYLNLIHRDDAAEAVLAAWQRPGDRLRMYLVADDQPLPRRRFYQQIARLTGGEEPQFSDQGPPRSPRSASNKRVWNRRMRHHLLPRMQYPNCIQGLTAILKSLR